MPVVLRPSVSAHLRANRRIWKNKKKSGSGSWQSIRIMLKVNIIINNIKQ